MEFPTFKPASTEEETRDQSMAAEPTLQRTLAPSTSGLGEDSEGKSEGIVDNESKPPSIAESMGILRDDGLQSDPRGMLDGSVFGNLYGDHPDKVEAERILQNAKMGFVGDHQLPK